MIVTCPGCDSNYRVPNEKVPPGGARMRCPQCSTEFLAQLPDDDTAPAPPKPKVPPLPAAVSAQSSPGLPLPGVSGALPITAPRPNPFAKQPASGAPGQPFGGASLPPSGLPLPQTPEPLSGPEAPAPAAPPAAMPAPRPPAAPAYAAPPSPPPQAYAPSAQPPSFPAPVSGGFAIPPPAPAPAYGQPAPTPPPAPHAAFASPGPPPAAPSEPDLGAVDFDPLDDAIFGGAPRAAAAIPREVTGIFEVPDLAALHQQPPPPPPAAFSAPAPPPPPGDAPAPVSSPNAGYTMPAAPPAGAPVSPFGGASYAASAAAQQGPGPFGGPSFPPTGAPAQPAAGAFDGPSFPPAGVPVSGAFGEPSFSPGGGPPAGPGNVDLPSGAPFATPPNTSGSGLPLAGASPGDDDDPFAAIFDAALANHAAASAGSPPLPAGPAPGSPSDPPPQEGPSADSLFDFAPDDAAPDKSGMKAALARAMDAKKRAGALKEEQSPTSRGFDAPAFSADDPSRELVVNDEPLTSAPAEEPVAVPAPPAPAPPPSPPPPAEAPARAKSPPRALPRSLKEGVAWGALFASSVVLVGGVLFAGWTTGDLPLDDLLMPHAERRLGVRPPWSFVGLDDTPLATLEKAAEQARQERDLALEGSAWRRVLVSAPDHEDARRRLKKILTLLGEPRALDDVTPR